MLRGELCDHGDQRTVILGGDEVKGVIDAGRCAQGAEKFSKRAKEVSGGGGSADLHDLNGVWAVFGSAEVFGDGGIVTEWRCLRAGHPKGNRNIEDVPACDPALVKNVLAEVAR